MADKGGRSAKTPDLGDFNFFGASDGDHEGSVAFSDISFPSHVSDLESFHSDLDISMQSRDSISSMPAEQQQCHEDDRQENDGELSDLPEHAAENVDVLLAALKAATMRESSSDRASIGSNRSANSSTYSHDSSRFLSKESFPGSLLAETSASWTKEKNHSSEENPGEAASTVLSEEKYETSMVQPDSRLSEKFLAPSKTPDNGHADTFGGEKSGASPWSFSGDSLLFQTPRPGGDSSTLPKSETFKRYPEAKTAPSTLSTPVELNQLTRPSISNDTFPVQQDRLSDMDFRKATYNPFDGSHVDGLNNETSSKRSSEAKTKPSSSSTPVERPSIPNDTFPVQQDRLSEMNFSKVAYNPFDGSHDDGLRDETLEKGNSLFGDGDGFSGNDIPGEFSFQSADDAAKRLDEDQRIFEESHRFDKEDPLVGDNPSFSFYVLPGDSRMLVKGINDPNDKGEVRISFGEFFAAGTEELGRLGDGNENRPRPQFSDTRTKKVSPVAMPPRTLYRPSSPEGSEKDTSYQQRFSDLEKAQQKSSQANQSQAKKHVVMATRSSPYGAEAEEEGNDVKKGDSFSKNETKYGGKMKENDLKSSKQKRIQAESSNADGQENTRRNSGGLELNNSTLAALKFCHSSEGSKISEMSSNELKSLSKTLARANMDDAQEIYKVLVNFINKKDTGPESTSEVVETMQRLSDVFEFPGRESGGQGGAPQDGDAMRFYNSSEVSPTDPKCRTMSSMSSPPLDSSSPKNSGITVQTESPGTEQVLTLPLSEPDVPVGGTVNVPVCTSLPTAGPYDHYHGNSHSGTGSFNSVPSKQYATLPGQRTSPNTMLTTSATRTIIPNTNSNPPSLSPGRSYGKPQILTSVATSSVPSEQNIYGANNRPFSHSDPGIPNLPFGTGLQGTHHPDVQRYPPPGKGYQTYPNLRMSDPSAMNRYPVHAVSHAAAGQRFYQFRGADKLDPRTGRPLPGTGHTIATLTRAVSASCHVLPAQSHAARFPGHANTDSGLAYMRTDHVNAGPRHAIPVLGHASTRPSHAIGDPSHAIQIHAFTNSAHEIGDPKHAVPIQSHGFTRTEHANADSKHVIPISSHAAFRPIQTAHGMHMTQATSGYSAPGTSGNVLAQTCPAYNGARFTPPVMDPGYSQRTSQSSTPNAHGKPRTMSGSFQNRHIGKFQEPKPMSAPHMENVFNYQDIGQEEYRVVSDVYNQDDAHTRHQRGWAGPGQRQGEAWNSRTERTSQIQMVIPPVLDFFGVQCVGTSAEADLSIYNPTSRWIRCSSEIVACTVNGLKVDNQECPFSIRGKTMIGPKQTENLKVDFKCLSAGVFVADMKVISTPVASISGDIETSSALVSLQGFAEEPKIEIITDELRTLDFGEIHYGCNSVKPLRIINKGMTIVPLKMRICSSSSPGVFVFSKSNFPDAIPELDLQNTTLKCLVPATNELGMNVEPLVIWIELAGKNQHCFEKSDEAEILSAGINIQLDTGTVAKILGNIQLSAVMGFTKIQIPKAFQMAMCLSSPVGKRVSREFPFTNAGNICANVELTVPKHLDVFSVTPDQFQVRPGKAVMVEVMFTPLCKESCESVIQVLEPDNSKCYEVLLRGSAVEPQPEMDDGSPILSNKSWLCWTGVDLGNSTHQRLFLLNDSADHSIHFQATILGEHADFEIQRMRSEFSKGGAATEQMVLRPKERMPIYVLFAPSSFGVFKSALVLKPDRGPRFQIPLYAYGGRSCLSFLDLKKTTEGYDAQLGEVSLGRRNILKITVKNTGQRAAFVKAVCYADFQIRLHYHQTHLSIVPSEFVLPERSSKELVIVYQPLQHDAKACQSDMKRVATVVFYHGDEALRQWYRRNLVNQQERRHSKTLKFDDIRFDKVFQDENCAAEDFDFPNLENYEQIFDSHISQTFLNLVGGSEKHVVHPAEGVAEESLVMATPRRRRVEPETDTSSHVKSDKAAEVKEIEEKDDNTAWSLIPEQLSLKVPRVQGSSDSTKKVQLLNFSDRPLEFELIWPAHCIAVTPHTGAIAPKSQTTINISAWGSILKSGVDLPWSGTAYVKCDGIKKTIAIQIHNPLVSDNSPAPSVIDKPLSIIKANKEEPRLSQTYTAFVKPVKQSQLLKVSPTMVDFAEVDVNKAASSIVTIKNISASSIRWKISSFAPAYAKVSDTSCELLRATYPVFSFSTQSGFIRPSQVVKIQVEFRARDAGDYCQIWECQTNPESPLTSTKVKLELSGKAVAKESSTAVAEKPKDKKNVDKKKLAIATARESLQEYPSKDSNEPTKGGKTDVYFQSDDVEFPDTEVGQTSTVKVKICNKSSSEQQFRVVTPSAPFYMNCSSNLVSKPLYYLRIPVYFSPQESGKHYKATVVFENKNSGETLTVKLRANSL